MAKLEELENDLQEMFGMSKRIALAEDCGSPTLSVRISAAQACAQLALAIAEIREQRFEEERAEQAE